MSLVGDASYKEPPHFQNRLTRNERKILHDGEARYGVDAGAAANLHLSHDTFGSMGADVLEAHAAVEASALSVAAAAAPPAAAQKRAPAPPAAAKALPKQQAVAAGAAAPRLRIDATVWPKPLRHLLAGAISAGVSKTATAPLEAVRMKLMVDKGGATLASVVAATWKEGGVAAFFNGNLTDVLRTAPQKSVQLAAFDVYKRAFARPNPKTGKRETSGLASTVAGSLAGVTSTITCFPLEVLRTRLACSTEYKNAFQAAVMIAQKEGFRAFYGGLGPSLVGVIPCNLGMYDGLRRLYKTTTGQERVPNSAALCIGALAGVSASTVTFPLEVVRRRMMMGQKYKNTLAALLAISKDEGTGALFKGCALNWVKLAPSAGLSFYAYEEMKDALKLR